MAGYLAAIINVVLGRSKSEKGATAVEYALIVFLIAIFIIAAVALAGTNINNIFNSIATAL